MTYRLDCNHCGTAIAVLPARAGSSMTCPQCDQTVSIPRLGDLKQLPPMPNGGEEKKSSRSTGEADSPLPMIAVGLIAAAAALVACYAGLRWFLSPVEYTTERHLAAYRSQYDQVPAAVLIREYESIEEYGLELPIEAQYIKQARIKREWGNTAATSIAVALLTGTAMVMLAKRRGR